MWSRPMRRADCTVLSGDVSMLAVARAKMKQPADHMILPELITKEPAGPAVRQDDAQWFAVVRWTLSGAHRGGGARHHQR